MSSSGTGSVFAQAGHDPFIIAEIGVNHDGRLDRGLELVQSAASAGADAVKFQWFDARELLSSSAALVAYQREAGESDAHQMLDRLQLSSAEMVQLINCARRLGLQSIVTVFTPGLVAEAMKLPWDMLKTASPDLINRPLLEAVRATGLPLLVSTGGSTLQEVQESLSWIGSYELGVLHCVSSYPTAEAEASLGAIRVLAEATGLPVGYSDHTTALETGGLAVAAGATILEKHLTWDRTAKGPDHATSMPPVDFAGYVAFARRARQMLGEYEKSVGPSEQAVIAASRQSVSVRTDIPSGTLLQREHLSTMRPGSGIPPARLDSLIGRRVVRMLPSGSLLSYDDLHSESES